MTDEKLKLLCNGIASIADATEWSFFDVMEELVGTVISEEQASEATAYMESL